MRIISDKTGKEYSSVEECMADEKKYEEALALKIAKEQELSAERKARAVEVEDAYKAVLEAMKHYKELLDEFIKDYGSFHMTIHTGDFNPFNSFNRLFDKFWF